MPDVTKVITTKDYVIGETLVFEGELLYATENLSDEGFKEHFNVYSSGGILGPVAGTWQEYGGGLFMEASSPAEAKDGRRLDDAKKAEALSLHQKGMSVTGIHREAGVSRPTIYKWIKEAHLSPSGSDEVSNLGELSIEIFDPTVGNWAQAKYLVHGHDDVLWTDDLDSALEFLRDSCSEKRDA